MNRLRLVAWKRAKSWTCCAAAVLSLAVSLNALAADGSAAGTLTKMSPGAPITVGLKYVWLVKGPDPLRPEVTIRHLIFSATDLGARIASCKTMGCMDGAVHSGMTVDLDVGPRLNYWVSLNDQRVQYSGTVVPSALKLTTETPTHLAGKLTIDDAAAGGAKVDVEFDAPLWQELKPAP
jgi:hypothetical protein